MDYPSRQLVFLAHMVILEVLVCTKIVGVTHWKLQENIIVPASAASSSPSTGDGAGEAADELFWSSVSGEDPEFSVLMKRTTGADSTAGSLGTVAGGGAANAGNRNCGSKKCPRGQKPSSPKEKACARKSEDCETPSPTTAPRYPDGSGPM